MRNIYGVKLGQNNYAPSILNERDGECFVCGRGGDLARHEVFFGSNRERSKELGLWINVCPECHAEIHQKDKSLDRGIKEIAQMKAMDHYGWDKKEFRQHFGKNWL